MNSLTSRTGHFKDPFYTFLIALSMAGKLTIYKVIELALRLPWLYQ